jgi:hypothetical protein
MIAEVPMTKASRYTPSQVNEYIELLMDWMPFRSRWIGMDNFIQLGCMNKCLKV